MPAGDQPLFLWHQEVLLGIRGVFFRLDRPDNLNIKQCRAVTHDPKGSAPWPHSPSALPREEAVKGLPQPGVHQGYPSGRFALNIDPLTNYKETNSEIIRNKTTQTKIISL